MSPTFFLPSAVMIAKLIEVEKVETYLGTTYLGVYMGAEEKTAEALDGTKMLNSYFSAPIVL